MTAYVGGWKRLCTEKRPALLAGAELPELAVGENSILIEAVNGTFSELEIKARSRWR